MCFFSWNLEDQLREVAKMRKEKPEEYPAAMSISDIFEKHPLSFWQGKVRRCYFPGKKAVANLEAFYRAWVDGPKGIDHATGSQLINDGFVDSFREILKLAKDGSLSGEPPHVLLPLITCHVITSGWPRFLQVLRCAVLR